MPGKKGKKSSGKKGNGATQTERAGLEFPVSRVGRWLREKNMVSRVGKTAAVSLAGIMEYLTSEILELAGNICEEDKRKRITPKHLQQAVRSDDEFAKLMANTVLSNGGVAPNVHAFLLKKKKGGPTQDA